VRQRDRHMMPVRQAEGGTAGHVPEAAASSSFFLSLLPPVLFLPMQVLDAPAACRRYSGCVLPPVAGMPPRYQFFHKSPRAGHGKSQARCWSAFRRPS